MQHKQQPQVDLWVSNEHQQAMLQAIIKMYLADDPGLSTKDVGKRTRTKSRTKTHTHYTRIFGSRPKNGIYWHIMATVFST
jgi:DNA integrity scanning protein DisA with diadenylate cyclase activity